MYTNDQYGEDIGIIKTISVSTTTETETTQLDKFLSKKGVIKERENELLNNKFISYDATNLSMDWEELEDLTKDKYPNASLQFTEGESDEEDDFSFYTENLRIVL